MQLTKKQKIEVIEKAYIYIFTKKNDFICTAIKNVIFEKLNISYDSDKILNDLFPEFEKYKPKKISVSTRWFDKRYRKRRMLIISNVIKDIKNS